MLNCSCLRAQRRLLHVSIERATFSRMSNKNKCFGKHHVPGHGDREVFTDHYVFLAVLASAALLHCESNDKFSGVKPLKADIARLDSLHENHCLEECYNVAKAMAAYDVFCDNVEVQWRWARSAYLLAMDPKTDSSKRKSLLEEALGAVTAAKARHHNCGSLYRWAGTILQASGQYLSSGDYIRNSFLVRDDWLNAATLDPYDASARHLLGRWEFDVARMPGWKRTIAATLFAEPPSGSLEASREYFLAAESISPGFWISNEAWLGAVEEALGNKNEAARWAAAAVELPVISYEDEESHSKALTLLKRLDPAAAEMVSRRDAAVQKSMWSTSIYDHGCASEGTTGTGKWGATARPFSGAEARAEHAYDAELAPSTTLSASAMSLSNGMRFDDESPSGDSPLAGGDGAVGSPPAVQGSTATGAGAVRSSVRVLDCTSLRTFGLVL